ncbi:MAG: biotin/lipoyl-containing protein, partial [Pusillimonas sp.]
MGTHIIKMPDIGEGIAEVELVEWHVQPGDAVAEDQVLADVMTDKATVQVPSPVDGIVEALGGKVGEVMAVGSELIRLRVEGQGNTTGGSARGRPSGQVQAVPGQADRGLDAQESEVQESEAQESEAQESEVQPSQAQKIQVQDGAVAAPPSAAPQASTGSAQTPSTAPSKPSGSAARPAQPSEGGQGVVPAGHG